MILFKMLNYTAGDMSCNLTLRDAVYAAVADAWWLTTWDTHDEMQNYSSQRIGSRSSLPLQLHVKQNYQA
jgi:hypothetical protein